MNEVKVAMLKFRKKLLMTRDPVANANIARKIERRIRLLESSN